MRLLLLLIALIALPTWVAGAAAELTDRTFRECVDCPEMVAIPAGRFMMGSPAAERGRFEAEGPQHEVALRAFAIGKYEVTNAEVLAFLRETGYEPGACDPHLDLAWHSPGGGRAATPGAADLPRQPAACLSQLAAQAYVDWLNGKVRRLRPSVRGAGPYRLPSEAEWEYAARGGTTSARWWGDEIGKGKADCNGCGSKWDGKYVAEVGSFGPNPFGLYDMLGNVWQWMADCWHDSYVGAPRDGGSWTHANCMTGVLRGGAWNSLPVFVRSAARSPGEWRGDYFDPSSNAGFRVVRNLP